jgi:hypothetical protein
MLDGPDQYITCPLCGGYEKYMTLISGNTFGMKIWSDGKRDAPGLPEPPSVVKCRHCAECYWLSEANEIKQDEIPPEVMEELFPISFEEDFYVNEPSEEEYYRAIDKGLAKNNEEEKSLRILAWWRRNDAFRDSKNTDVPDGTNLWKTNLEALEKLLTTRTDDDSLMKAEILRELGEFDRAKQILKDIDSPDLSFTVRQIQALCDAQDSCVREIKFKT